jgi:hypothetical protein
MPYAIAWRGQNPYQVLPEPLAQSYPWLNEHTVGTVYFGGWDPRIFTIYKYQLIDFVIPSMKSSSENDTKAWKVADVPLARGPRWQICGTLLLSGHSFWVLISD